MIGWLVKFLTGNTVVGAAGPWLLLTGLLGIASIGGYVGYQAKAVLDASIIAAKDTEIAKADGRTESCKATHEKGRADSAEQALGQISAAAGDVRAAAADLATKAGARDAANARFLKDIANVPKTSICAGSPADLAYRRSVQQPTGAAATP